MRSFEQRIAEIDRRSKEILQQRQKKRKHILMACVPLVLCVTLCALLFPSGTASQGSITPPAATGSFPGHKNESTLTPITQIEVLDSHGSRTYTESSEIQKISALLFSCTNTPEDGRGVTGETKGDISLYTITLTAGDGTITRYVLTETTLTHTDTNRVYPLSQEQSEDLHRILGLSD